jgi:hypothetical protein
MSELVEIWSFASASVFYLRYFYTSPLARSLLAETSKEHVVQW